MFLNAAFQIPGTLVPTRILNFVRATAAIAVLCAASLLTAQTQSGQSSQQPANNQQNQNTTGEAGGPKGDIGPIAVPKKGDDNDATTKKDVPPKPKPIAGMHNFSIHVSVPVVTLDVGVLTTKEGMFVPGLKQNQFRVLEDGVPQ